MMKTWRSSLVGALALLPLFLVLSCADGTNPTAGPDTIEPAAGLLSPVTDLVGEVTTLRRTESVSEGECASDVPVGSGGGVVECAEAGLRLEIPSGALDRTVEITVNIPRGDLVGYEFSPHLTFDRKVRLSQSLDGTEAENRLSLLSLLVGAYADAIEPVVTPLELYAVGYGDDPDGGTRMFYDIQHFSGYLCASN